MREIKFRAWHKPFKDNDFGAGYKYGNNVISFHDMSPEKYELEQYTGMTDKNGVEIYEGDILQHKASKFINFAIVFKYGCYYAHDTSEIMSDELLGSLNFDNGMTVIGNIHENPELLEVEA